MTAHLTIFVAEADVGFSWPRRHYRELRTKWAQRVATAAIPSFHRWWTEIAQRHGLDEFADAIEVDAPTSMVGDRQYRKVRLMIPEEQHDSVRMLLKLQGVVVRDLSDPMEWAREEGLI